MTIQWSDPIPYNGSGECPADARYVACSIDVWGLNSWMGLDGKKTGANWIVWGDVTAYRLPIAAPSIADELAEALEFMYENGDGYDARAKARAVLAKYRRTKE